MDELTQFKRSFDVAALLSSSESCVSVHMYEIMLNDAMSSLSSKAGKKAEIYHILRSCVKHCSSSKLNSIAERLPGLVEGAANDEIEEEALVALVEELLVQNSPDFVAQLSKILTKLVKSLCTSFSKHPRSHIGFKMLQVMAKSAIRSSLSLNARDVCKACLADIDNSNNRAQIATTYALYAAMESSDNFSNHFYNLTQEAYRVLLEMGIPNPKHQAGLVVVWPKTSLPQPSIAQSGALRAMFFMERFSSLCAILQQLLVFGCASGAVSLDVTSLVAMEPWLMDTEALVDPRDTKSQVRNEKGLSQLDLSLVVTKMKIALVELVTMLFTLNPPSLLMVGAALYLPLTKRTSQVDFSVPTELGLVPALRLALIRAVTAAVRCFPNLVVSSVNDGVVSVVEWLRSDVAALTAVRSLVSSGTEGENATAALNGASSSSAPTSAVRTDITAALVDCCEQVLVHCSVSLSASRRQQLEDLVGLALQCLARGLIHPQYIDRRMHRSQGEILRQSPELQAVFLRLAGTEVLCPSSRIGVGSSNVSLLRRVAEQCLGHPATAAEAARVLLVVGALLHPSSVALPAIPAKDVALGYLGALDAAKTKAVDDLKRRAEEAEELVAYHISAEETKRARREAAEKKEAEQEEEVITMTVDTTPAPVAAPVVRQPLPPLPDFSKKPQQSASTPAPKTTALAFTSGQDSDDEELPEIEL